MKKNQLKCMNDDCGVLIDPGTIHTEGMRCCKCGGFVEESLFDRFQYHIPFENIVRHGKRPKEHLLVIELDNESTKPRVYYKGEEIKLLREIDFRWMTDKEMPGGLLYSIENIDKGPEQSAINKIERKIKGYAFDS